MIWDIQSNSHTLSVSSSAPSSVASPISRPHPHLPRIESNARTDHRVIQQHVSTEMVSSLAFLPDSTHLLLAGIAHRWLRFFDLRSQTPSITNVASKVHGIVTDPFDAHRFASFGDGIVSVWDARWLTSALLTFSEKDAIADGALARSGSTYSAIEFSNSRRGMLATLEKDAAHIRFWDVMQTQGTSDTERSRHSSLSTKLPRMSWANLPWAAGQTDISSMTSSKDLDSQPSGYTLTLCDTRKSTSRTRILAHSRIFILFYSQQRNSNVPWRRLLSSLALRNSYRRPKLSL
jgi:WD repeat-containing protein mio